MCEGYPDLEEAENIRLIHRSRRSHRGRNAGGGIAIAYNKTRIRLNEYKFKHGNAELVCATGKVLNNPRSIVLIGAYIPPKNTKRQDEETFEYISDLILKVKDEMNDPIIILAGDFNRRNISKAYDCLLYTSPSPRDLSTSRMPSSA